jgi:hypothetical protein
VQDALTVQGINTTRYGNFSVRPFEAVERTGSLDFGVIDWQGARKIDGGEGSCLINRWVLRKQTDVPLWVSSKVMLSPLVELGHSDQELLDDHQSPTTRWDTNGNPIETFSWLPLPAGLPAAQYTTRIKVYSDSSPNGIDGIGCQPAESAACVSSNFGTRPTIGTLDYRLLLTPFKLSQQDRKMGASVTIRPIETPLPNKQGECGAIFAQIGATDPQVLLAFLQYSGEQIVSTRRVLLTNGVNIQFTAEQFCIKDTQVEPVKLAFAMLTVVPDATGISKSLVPTEIVPIATIAVVPVPRSFTAPTLPNLTPIATAFPKFATLRGIQLPAQVRAGQPFDATLLWQTAYQKEANVRVFVQVLDDQGRLIAQHDGIPVDGTRPANNWEDGEYLIDTHRVEWARTDYKGAGKMIVGFYDPDTLLRVPTDTNQDHAEIPITIE